MIQDDQVLQQVEVVKLGQPYTRRDIVCAPGSFLVAPEVKVYYPQVVIEALGEIFAEYNSAFHSLVTDLECENDYQYCKEDDVYSNFLVQIDMVGLPGNFLSRADQLAPSELKQQLRRCLFEIENSLAGYDLLQRLFADEETSFFSRNFREALLSLKQRADKPIALLAITEEKYNIMLAYEFGLQPGTHPSPAEVEARTGFDAFFGPEQFREYLASTGGQCDYQLYVRASSPTSKLKNPELIVASPLLADDTCRRIIKQNALTFNVDAPDTVSNLRLNDTKTYLRHMGLAYALPAHHADEPLGGLLTPEFLAHLKEKKAFADFPVGARLRDDFKEFLVSYDVDPELVEVGAKMLRFKPERDSYGAYGHVRMSLPPEHGRVGELRGNLRRRGDYLVQPELDTPVLEDSLTGARYTYIDRNFFSMINGTPQFMGGFRTLMSVDSHEARKGRIHGSVQTVWAEILPE